MKRGASRQITSDDRSDDEYDGGGDQPMSRAPEQEISKRKIVKVRRKERNVSASNEPAVATNSTAFVGFSFNKGASGSGSASGKTSDVSKKSPSLLGNKRDSGKSGGSYSAKMRKLNNAFLSFLQASLQNNNGAMLNVAALEYVQSAEKITMETGGGRGGNGTKSIGKSSVDSDDVVEVNAPKKTAVDWNDLNKSKGISSPSKILAKKNPFVIPSKEEYAKQLQEQKKAAVAVALPVTNSTDTTTEKPKTSGLFSFNKNSALTDTTAPAPAADKPASSGMFNFNKKSSGDGTTETAKPAAAGGMFKFNTGDTKPASTFAPTSSTGNVAAGAGGAADDDDGGLMPAMPAEKVLKNENDKDEVLYETKCALKRYDTSGDEGPEWKDMGKGQFKVTKDPDTSKFRLLVREPTMGRILLNAGFFKGQKFTKVANKNKFHITFAAVVALPPEAQAEGSTTVPEEKTELRTFLLKVPPVDVDACLEHLNVGVKSVS